MDANEWLRIEGSTPNERIRNGYKQLLVVCVLAWAGAFVVWGLLSALIGGPAAAVVIVVLGVVVGIDLRDRMIGPIDEEHPTEQSGANEDTEEPDLEAATGESDDDESIEDSDEKAEQTESS